MEEALWLVVLNLEICGVSAYKPVFMKGTVTCPSSPTSTSAQVCPQGEVPAQLGPFYSFGLYIL